MASADPIARDRSINDVFLLRCRACIWKNLVLASPSLSHLILDLDRAMVRLKEASARDCFLSMFFSTTSGGVRG
jgi:hypothetical protein